MFQKMERQKMDICRKLGAREADNRKMEKDRKREKQWEDHDATVTVTIMIPELPGPGTELSPECPALPHV